MTAVFGLAESAAEIALGDRTKWGEGTVLIEGVPLLVALPADSGRVRCFALDPRGDRKQEVPVAKEMVVRRSCLGRSAPPFGTNTPSVIPDAAWVVGFFRGAGVCGGGGLWVRGRVVVLREGTQ